MRKIITLVSAVALMLGLFTGAAAAEDVTIDPELALLQQAVEEANALVALRETQLLDAQRDLTAAEAALKVADGDLAAKQAAVATAASDVLSAELALTAAQVARNAAQTAYDAINCAGLTGQNRASCNHTKEAALVTLNGATGDVSTATAELQMARDALLAAETLEGVSASVQKAAKDAFDQAVRDKATADQALIDAKVEQALAVAALEAYVPPTSAHAGCKGVQNAQQQVAKTTNGKGKASEALATVAAKLDCAA